MTTSFLIYKQVVPKNNTLFEKNTTGRRFQRNLLIAEFILMIFLMGSVTGADLSITWKERPEGESSFFGVMFSLDGSTVIASGVSGFPPL